MKPFSRRFICLGVSLWMLLPLVSCQKGTQKPRVKEANPLWSKYIGSHTSGLVSRRDKIQINFLMDLFSKEKVGQAADAVVSIEPSIDGTTTISEPHQIMIVPKGDLHQGQFYLVRIKGNSIEGLPDQIGDYEFVFQTIQQDFEVNIVGLAPTGEDDKQMELSGTILTADVEDSDPIEKLIKTQFLDQSLETKWTHDVSGKSHAFTISGIMRQSQSGKLLLSWDGDSIKVDRKGSLEVEVPAIGVFKVADIQPNQGEQQYIVVHFSDTLQPGQNLRGLVRVDQKNFTTRIEDNTIKIYPEKRFVGKVTVMVEPGILNSKGKKLEERSQQTVVFTSQNPQVKFAGKGVILPDNNILSIPLEAINVHSVQVTAFRVYENNMGQFLQTNKLDGTSELERVGRFLWRKTIELPSIDPDKWQRYDLDATQLVLENPGAMVRLTLSINRSNSSYSCTEEERQVTAKKEDPFSNHDDLYVSEHSSWDYAEDYYYGNQDSGWQDRNDPCKDGYYRYASGITDSRNFLASNIGLLAKNDQQGRLTVVATNLQTAEPLSGAQISVLNFQNQIMYNATTDNDGFADMKLPGSPFYLTARKGNDVGYLKLNAGSALATSHFDVGGEVVQSGVKGIVYGERGVWRPGDRIYLVFVLEDKSQVIPDNHPVTMNLFNPKDQLVQSITNSKPVGDFYAFTLQTDENAETGSWTAKAQLGGRTFTKKIKVETVMPNRLKVELDFGKTALHKIDMPIKGTVFGQWLQGATAANLKTDVKVRLQSTPTKFERFADFVFDDPSREFKTEEEMTVLDGELDEKGYAKFTTDLGPEASAPGMLMAQFNTRVFEEGGAFSSSQKSLPYYPYKNFVGIKLPKGDQTRNMLLTDRKHVVSIGSLNSKGEPVSLKRVKVALYKVEWKWWWDKSEDTLAHYMNSQHSHVIQEGEIQTAQGQGQWEMEVKYPDWGRYLVRACDEEGGHCSGKILYIDWPGWAGRAQEDSTAGANVLQFFSDKPEYIVGETATIQLPEASQGRALLTIENGSGVIDRRWMQFGKEKTKFELPISAAMSPNVYVSVVLIQPHQNKNNDRPIRLYGVIPLRVKDPATILEPVIQTADEWRPESKSSVKISEAKGRPMAYTLAVVDEGLLGLTGFDTPDLRSFFYKKEALGVTTWDLYDYVVGAYGAALERLLALGGDTGLEPIQRQEEKRRFPPVVQFLGPFQLDKGGANTHEIQMPPYVGSVRAMVVAGQKGAYGRAQKSVFVREALTLLPTLPRVVGPSEELTVPVTVFVMDKTVQDVTVSMTSDTFFQILGKDSVTLPFPQTGEKMCFFRIKVSSAVGQGSIRVQAVSGAHKSRSETYLTVRSPNPVAIKQHRQTMEAGTSWSQKLIPHGLSGTNQISLEVSAIPPLDLERRLDWLIRYPHGCVEQVTSSVFPQLYLSNLVKLEDQQKKNIETNVKAGIDRLRGFQVANGGFVYWPGGFSGEASIPNPWATNYAGHFLVEAEKKGYFVPPNVLSEWAKFQKSLAQSWNPEKDASSLDQAYRLYTLALAGQAEIGAMNRLREIKKLPNVARWQLAAAYQLVGQSDAANELVKRADFLVDTYADPGMTFGSDLRDKGMILNCLTILKSYNGKELIDEISSDLNNDRWHSTQSLAYALMAMSNFIGARESGVGLRFEYGMGSKPVIKMESKSPIHTIPLVNYPLAGDTVIVKNTSDKKLFVTLTSKGVPPAGQEEASASGLNLQVTYTDSKGKSIDVSRLDQGMDILAQVVVRNLSDRKIENIALTHMAASGWEIHNPRLTQDDTEKKSALDYQDVRDDRIFSYFSLNGRSHITVTTRLNAAYLGRYYLPGVSVEAMYDASKHALSQGQWVTVVRP